MNLWWLIKVKTILVIDHKFHDMGSRGDSHEEGFNQLKSLSSEYIANSIFNLDYWRRMNYDPTYDPTFPWSCFSGDLSVKNNISDIPINFFNIYFKLINHICEETNKFATHICITNWKDITCRIHKCLWYVILTSINKWVGLKFSS